MLAFVNFCSQIQDLFLVLITLFSNEIDLSQSFSRYIPVGFILKSYIHVVKIEYYPHQDNAIFFPWNIWLSD